MLKHAAEKAPLRRNVEPREVGNTRYSFAARWRPQSPAKLSTSIAATTSWGYKKTMADPKEPEDHFPGTTQDEQLLESPGPDEFTHTDTWRVFRIMGEFVEASTNLRPSLAEFNLRFCPHPR